MGELPVVGNMANDFTVTGTNLQDLKLMDFPGKKVLLNIFPSIKTGVC
jgi:thiol peroxidase